MLLISRRRATRRSMRPRPTAASPAVSSKTRVTSRPHNSWKWNGRTVVELVGILAGCGLLIGAFSMNRVVSSLARPAHARRPTNAFLLLAQCAFTRLILRPRPDHDRLLHLPSSQPGGAALESSASTGWRSHFHLLLGHASSISRRSRSPPSPRPALRPARRRLRRAGNRCGRQHHLCSSVPPPLFFFFSSC